MGSTLLLAARGGHGGDTHLGGAEDSLIAGRVGDNGEGSPLIATQDGVHSSPRWRVQLVQVGDSQPGYLPPSCILRHGRLILRVCGTVSAAARWALA